MQRFRHPPHEAHAAANNGAANAVISGAGACRRSIGSYQAPVAIWATLARMPSVSRAPARNVPRCIAVSRRQMPNLAASLEFIPMCWLLEVRRPRSLAAAEKYSFHGGAGKPHTDELPSFGDVAN